MDGSSKLMKFRCNPLQMKPISRELVYIQLTITKIALRCNISEKDMNAEKYAERKHLFEKFESLWMCGISYAVKFCKFSKGILLTHSHSEPDSSYIMKTSLHRMVHIHTAILTVNLPVNYIRLNNLYFERILLREISLWNLP